MIVAHIMGLPIEETIPQLAPAGAVTLLAVAVAGRTWLGRAAQLARGVLARTRGAVRR